MVNGKCTSEIASMFEGQAIIIEAYATHRITNIEGGETVLHPGGVALDSEHPAPVIYTVCPLEVQTAVIASCEHRWPERAMGSHWGSSPRASKYGWPIGGLG